MVRGKILWADDEIDMLKAHILFIEEQGYKITPVNSGQDAIELFQADSFDIVFIDENMPGLSGLQTLDVLKKINPSIPIIMITKSEDEGIMTHAIGKKIADYLIKPVNPNQILLSLKKNLHQQDIVSESVLEGYRGEFMQLSEQISDASTHQQWQEVYHTLLDWEMKLEASKSPLMDLLHSQKQEANQAFFKFVRQNYERWFSEPSEAPLLSNQLFEKQIFPMLDAGDQVYVILIDNFRMDQWLAVRSLLSDKFSFAENSFYSILPTATQYARNAMFAGLMPREIEKRYPHYWVDEEHEGGKNEYEAELLQKQIERSGKNYTFSYHKLVTTAAGERLLSTMNELKEKQLNVIVVNFIDMLSHARTDSKMIRELASDESAYRSLTYSWFKHSSTIEMMNKIAEMGGKVIITADHGTIRVSKPQRVQGDKSLNTNLRYKVSKRMEYDRKKVFDILKPENIGLPAPNISTRYIFAGGTDFFAYPNEFNHYASYYTDTFQHGGVSMEEMIVPLITITPK